MYYPMEWNASRPSAWKHLPQPAELVIISHSASDPCESFQSCAKKVKSFQNYHISNLKYTDICYNFVIGGDGNVYVGRGWDVVNCHTRISIGINFIGNFMRDTLNRTMIDCMEELLHRGVRYGKVAKDYTLVGHNQTTSTLSPGDVYNFTDSDQDSDPFATDGSGTEYIPSSSISGNSSFSYNVNNLEKSPLSLLEAEPQVNLLELIPSIQAYLLDLNDIFSSEDRQGKSRIRISWLNFIFMTLDQNRRLVRNISLLSAAIFLVLIVVLILIRKFVHDAVDYDYDFKDAFYGDHLGNHSVFYRKDWGGLPPKMNTVPLEHCTPLLIISHSATRQCAAVDGCIRKVKYLQRDHQINVNTLDIGLNFVIGGDSNIYVGRGWDIENYRRKNSLLVGFIGDYVFDILTKDMIDAAEQLISQGVQLGKLCLDYEMVGENQTSPSKFLSPGENVYKVIKTWPHFVNKTIF
ncbi:hypothetical protein JTB14_030312 [Gonioctena quinquepunctata]|nr:hypothetical protein JTB14_030312 [Gonioctena quinquepunctata]